MGALRKLTRLWAMRVRRSPVAALFLHVLLPAVAVFAVRERPPRGEGESD
jgi:hypothetical protein